MADPTITPEQKESVLGLGGADERQLLFRIVEQNYMVMNAIAGIPGGGGTIPNPLPVSFATPLSTTDAGPAWTTSRGIAGARFTSVDQSGSFASITDAPASGQKLVITDMLVSSDTALRLDFAEESVTGTVIETVYMAANETKQITMRGKWKLPTADKKLQVKASAAGNISLTPYYYSEA